VGDTHHGNQKACSRAHSMETLQVPDAGCRTIGYVNTILNSMQPVTAAISFCVSGFLAMDLRTLPAVSAP
jgi:hypothetical protein